MTEAKQQLPENKMGTMPVGKLIFSMSVPMMISMIVQALYNIVDSIFVSMISEQALTAVSLAFPLQSLMIAFSTGIGVGINAHLSRALGEKKMQRANRTAASGLLLELCFALLFVLTGIFLAVPFFRAQTADPEIFSYGVLYTRIVCCGSLGIFAEITFERFLQSTGRTTLSMYSQLSGALFNLVMDPVLIFGLFGAPKLGIAGAALATVLGQHLSALVAILLNQTKNPEVKLHAKSFGFYPELLGHILAVGIPSTIMQALSSFMVYAMNQILIGFTATATAILGVYFKISSLIFMPVFGLNNGTVPILAYNYGAGHKR
ncbi:MAG: MATE family efflux transporter, partial [Stomatobaculum longum]|nr:MATE family efflux transporter [Stomatobaculum longum]